jgi:hypothetical protein
LRPRTIGAWNPTGWLFGLHRRKVKSGGRPADVKKRNLPPLANVKDVLALLGIPDAVALKRLCRAGTTAGSPYVEFEIDKEPSAFTITITGIPAVAERVFDWA